MFCYIQIITIIKIIKIMKSMSLVMFEQQKMDETIESITNKDKKKNTKIVQSSTAFEKEQVLLLKMKLMIKMAF